MHAIIRIVVLSLSSVGIACSQPPAPTASQANTGIDSLNARLVSAYQTRDPTAYGAPYTDSAVFE